MSFLRGLWARNGGSFAWALLPFLICGELFCFVSKFFFCSFQIRCYSCINSLRILNIPIVKSVCDCFKFLHFVESECVPLLLISLVILLSVIFPFMCWSSSFLWARTEWGFLLSFPLYSLLPAQQMYGCLHPAKWNLTCSPIISCWYYHPIRAIACPGVGPVSTAFSSPSQNCCCCCKLQPQEWS